MDSINTYQDDNKSTQERTIECLNDTITMQREEIRIKDSLLQNERMNSDILMLVIDDSGILNDSLKK